MPFAKILIDFFGFVMCMANDDEFKTLNTQIYQYFSYLPAIIDMSRWRATNNMLSLAYQANIIIYPT